MGISFMKNLPRDLESYLQNDVTLLRAMKCVFLKLSFQAVILFRFACVLRKVKILTPVALFIDYISTILTSCHISSTAKIGPGFCLPHASGVVIGEGVELGRDCTVYQGVTIGRKTYDIDAYPQLGDKVVIYSGSCVIGDIHIGNNVIIGTNSTVLKNVLSDHIVAGSPAKVVGYAKDC